MRKLPPVPKPYHLNIWFSNKFAYSQIVRKVGACLTYEYLLSNIQKSMPCLTDCT